MMRQAFLFPALFAVFLWLLGAFAQSLPDKPPYNTPVSYRSVEPGTSLEVALRAAAKAAGVRLLIKDVPKDPVVLDLKGVPFRRFLDLLLRVYAPNHAYTLLPEGVVLVATREDIARLTPAPPPPPAPKPEEAPPPLPETTGTLTVVLPAEAAGPGLAEAAKALGLSTVLYVEAARTLVLQGSPEAVERVVPILRDLEARAQAQKQAAKKEEAPPAKPPEPAYRVLSLPNVDVLKAPEGRQGLSATLGVEILPASALGLYLVRGEEKAVERAASLLSQMEEEARKAKPEEPRKPVLLAYPAPQNVPQEEALKALEALLSAFGEGRVRQAGGILLVEVPPDRAEAFDKAAKTALGTLKPEEPKKSTPALSKAYPIYGDPEDLAKGLKALLEAFPDPEARVEVLPKQKSVLVVGPLALHQRVVDFLRQADPPKGEDAPAAKTRVRFQLTYLSPSDAETLLKNLGFKDLSYVQDSTGGLWLEGPADQVAQAQAYLPILDSRPKQVRLAVRITQVERSALQSLDPSLQVALRGITAAIGGQGFSIAGTLPSNIANLLSVSLQALEGKGQARTLVSTENLVLDGATAALTSGGTLYTLTQSQGQSDGQQGGAAQAQTTALSTIEYGLVLRLTPSIRMNRTVQVDATMELGSLPTKGPIDNTIDVRKKKLSSTLEIPQGNTGVLGGLIHQENTRDEQGVPILSWIPIIGELFKTTKEGQKESVLLAMITPLEVQVPDLPGVIVVAREGAKAEKPTAVEDPRQPPTLPEPEKTPAPEVPQTSQTAQPSPVQPRVQEAASTPPVLVPEPGLPGYTGRAFAGAGRVTLYLYGPDGTPRARIAELLAAVKASEKEGKVGYHTAPLAYSVVSSASTFGDGEVVVVTASLPEARYDALIVKAVDELGRAGYILVPTR